MCLPFDQAFLHGLFDHFVEEFFEDFLVFKTAMPVFAKAGMIRHFVF
jgi:hypothetical protein